MEMNPENVNISSNKAYGGGGYNNVNESQHQMANSNMVADGPTSAGSQSSTPIGFTNGTMANTKEKTPMCLINELARFNKITHRYRLTDESGPAHKKIFIVTLELGPEEQYNASGPSIKKAQHAAAEVALSKTLFKHPSPKMHRNSYRQSGPGGDASCNMYQGTITPTVELNALAMKRGEPAIYHVVEPPVSQLPQLSHGRVGSGPYTYLPPHLYRMMNNQRYLQQNNMGYSNNRFAPPMSAVPFVVQLKVGEREFVGEGKTVQAARHNAASKAISTLKNLRYPKLNDFKLNLKTSDDENVEDDSVNNELLDADAELKSPISLVHEVALKRNMSVTFEVVEESGPPHMRTFITKCCVGDHETNGDGNGKKVSKKRAAERMLEELKKLPPLTMPAARKMRAKNPAVKKKSKNLIKEQKAHPEYGQNINPISRLIQIQQAKKEKEPVYTLMAEDGMPRKRQFIMQVEVGDQKCTGTGPNKKLAKRAAADAMLLAMGYSKSQKQPGKPAIKSPGAEGSNDDKQRKVMFANNDGGETRVANDVKKYGGCQIAPGLILMHSDNGTNAAMDGSGNSHMTPDTQSESTQAIAKELLHEGSAINNENMRNSAKGGIGPKQKLMYLAEVMNFSVTFSDFPKGNRSEFLSLVSLSTNPPEVSHGSGSTLEEAHNQAAIKALQRLANSGLDHVSGTAMASPNSNKPDPLMSSYDALIHSGNQKIASCLQNDYAKPDVKSNMMPPGGAK